MMVAEILAGAGRRLDRSNRWRHALARAVVRRAMRDRLRLLAERQALHAAVTDPAEIARWQVAAFNRVWRDALDRYRFYAAWQQRHGLPRALGHIAELERFPILRKADIEAQLAEIHKDALPCRFIGTGGSSGPSVLYPRGAQDEALLHSSMYLGRSRAAIRPGDSIVLIWGHDHLYGPGLKGRIVKAKRLAMDWLIDTRRLDVYRLDDASVAAYADIIRSRPGAVIVGYVSAIRKLLDFLERSPEAGPALTPRAVIFCSETVFPRDLARVRRLLGCPPLIEYGMAETGVMAYSGPESATLTLFWDAFHGHATQEQELVVTTLQPRHFPLINYGTGDRVELPPEGATLPFRCARITGRTRDVLSVPVRAGGGVDAHSELIEDCLDLVPGLRSYLIRQQGDRIDIAVRLDEECPPAPARERFLAMLARHLPDLDSSRIGFSRLEQEPLTIAGKRRYVVRE